MGVIVVGALITRARLFGVYDRPLIFSNSHLAYSFDGKLAFVQARSTVQIFGFYLYEPLFKVTRLSDPGLQ